MRGSETGERHMSTILTSDAAFAAEWILKGEVAAFPTETVYGLGADATRGESVEKIFQAKRRPEDNPLIVHVSGRETLHRVAARVSEDAERLMDVFFPGPLTLIMEKSKAIPDVVTSSLPTVGVRMPDHRLALDFLDACACPVAAPSANLSGRPSPTTWRAVFEDLSGRIPCILQGDPPRIGLESTVLDCSLTRPVVLRQGAVTLEMLRSVVAAVEIADSVTDGPLRSPGIKHRHYAPRASVRIVDNPGEVPHKFSCAFIGIEAHPSPDSLGRCLQVRDNDEYARALFAFFRDCDNGAVEVIYCQRPSAESLGTALLDRIERARKR
jgi:L-threonylcarbamoyladenylate synthase